MCMNRKYTPEEQMALDKMALYAKQVLQGFSLEAIARDDNTTVEEVKKMIEEIKGVNPPLYRQVKDELDS